VLGYGAVQDKMQVSGGGCHDRSFTKMGSSGFFIFLFRIRSFTYDSFCQFSNQIVSDVAQQEESLLGISMSDASGRHASHLLLVTRFVSKSH
jgi:hypothetical protein